jgi:LysR family transcriptional regulator, low CO2-responsive transcriptional regulator
VPMRHVTLRQLKVFETVARHLSHTRAAEELMLTQPAVSLQVKQLEEHVGIALFEQIGKKVHLTEAGHELHHYIRQITRQLTEAEEALDRLKGLESGSLRLAVVHSAKYFAPKLLGLFKERYGNIRVTLDVASRDELLGKLNGNDVDFAIMSRPPESPELSATPLVHNPLAITAAAHHPLAAAKDVAPARLATETWMLREPGSGTREVTDHFLQAHSLTPDNVMVMSSTEAIKQGVQANLGIAMMPLHAVQLELSAGRLAVLDVPGLPIQRTWYVVQREGKRLSHAAQAFKDFVLAEGAQHVTLPDGLLSNQRRA